jgi:GTP-binding protein
MQIYTYLLGYEPKGQKMESIRNGALVAVKSGIAVNYGIGKVQDRGVLFVGSGTEVYEGMIVGLANKPMDIEVNICKEKQLTNNRSVGEGVSTQITPPTILSLEQCIDLIGDDELLEITPTSLRLRKMWLNTVLRRVKTRNKKDLEQST